MSNSIAPGSSADVNVRVTALTTNPNVPAQYKTIILKKNLVNGVNTLTQEMMSTTNTKYVVKYDYVLSEDITVPAGCILEFDGGSISASGSNDSITGTNTSINASLVKIFNTDVTLAGTWNIAEAYPEWFGAVGDGTTEDTDALASAIALGIQGITIKLSNKTYLTDRQIIADCGDLKIVGDSGSTIKLKTLENGGNILQIQDGNTIYLENIIFDGNENQMIGNGGNLVQTNGNMVRNTILNCTFKDFLGASSNALGGAGNFFVDGCIFKNCGSGPYYATGTIQNCVIEECGWGLQLYTCKEFRIANNRFINNFGDICLRNPYQSDFYKGTIVGNTFTGTKGDDRPSIQIANTNPLTTRDISVVISNNVFDIQNNLIVFGEGGDNTTFTSNNIIFSNNIVKNCSGAFTFSSANNVIIQNNIISSTNAWLAFIYKPLKDVIIDNLLFTYTGTDTTITGFILIQGKYQSSDWKIDNFTLRNFRIKGVTSGNCWLHYYNEAALSQDSIINIENDVYSFPFNPQFINGGYQQDVINNLIYWKYIPGNDYLNIYGVRKSFAIGKPFLFNNKLYYWNGTEHKEM